MGFDIDTWLSGLGLDQYAEAFSENDVDAQVLPLLTNEDLKELGVSLGHRKKILASIEEAFNDSKGKNASGGSDASDKESADAVPSSSPDLIGKKPSAQEQPSAK